MNLFDIVKRRDRCLVAEDGAVEAFHRSGEGSGFLGVRFAAHSKARLVQANEFKCLATFPRDIGWQLHTVGGDAQPAFSISVTGVGERLSASGQAKTETIYRWVERDHSGPVMLTWPVWCGHTARFDIEFVNDSNAPVELLSSPIFNPRLIANPLIKGTGVEVGPGMNPFVKPREDVDVTYIEALPVDEWRRNYDKSGQASADNASLWQRYVLGDAQQLDCCKDFSLDFIFCSHVFEHLMNPLGVLQNWSAKLKQGGVAICIVPDLRYCFDLRQPPSTPNDWLDEYEANAWALTNAKYEKWCLYTAPYNTPESLIQRKYSIHTHYYTPSTFRDLADLAIARNFFSSIFLNTSPNNKDFGVVLWK